MTLRALDCRWTYSNVAFVSQNQTDPLLSLGGLSPNELNIDASAPYRQETLDATSTDPTIINDTETDTSGVGSPPAASDPAVDDWIMMVDGPAASEYAKVLAVNYGTGDITLDRALSALPQSGDVFRSCRPENLFPNVTLADAIAGVIDHRMIYLLKKTTGNENNHRFYVVPIRPNGCKIEIMAGGDGGSNAQPSDILAVATDDPFQQFGVVQTTSPKNNLLWIGTEGVGLRYSQDRASPENGSDSLENDRSLPIWVRRTIPAGVTAGECVFAIFDYVPDGVAQDAGADPNPFLSGFIFSWTIPERTYVSTIVQDRTVYTDGAARVTGTVVDSNGTPVPNLNCWLDIQSGPGSINTDLDGRTDSNGQIQAVYTAPSVITVDPVIRLTIPTHPDF